MDCSQFFLFPIMCIPYLGIKKRCSNLITSYYFSNWVGEKNHQLGVSLNGGTPMSHLKMIISSRKTPWLLGKPTILGTPPNWIINLAPMTQEPYHHLQVQWRWIETSGAGGFHGVWLMDFIEILPPWKCEVWKTFIQKKCENNTEVWITSELSKMRQCFFFL